MFTSDIAWEASEHWTRLRRNLEMRSAPISLHNPIGANVFRDLFAGLRDIVGGRSAGYERSLRQARETAIGEMVAEAEQGGPTLW